MDKHPLNDVMAAKGGPGRCRFSWNVLDDSGEEAKDLWVRCINSEHDGHDSHEHPRSIPIEVGKEGRVEGFWIDKLSRRPYGHRST